MLFLSGKAYEQYLILCFDEFQIPREIKITHTKWI